MDTFGNYSKKPVGYRLSELYCDPGRNDGYQTFRTYAAGLSGACTGWVQATLPINQPSSAKWASLAPHWERTCQTGYPAWHEHLAVVTEIRVQNRLVGEVRIQLTWFAVIKGVRAGAQEFGRGPILLIRILLSHTIIRL